MPPTDITYPDTPLGRTAKTLGGWAATCAAMQQITGRATPRSRSQLSEMARGTKPVPLDVAIAMEKITGGDEPAAAYFPWLAGIKLRRAA